MRQRDIQVLLTKHLGRLEPAFNPLGGNNTDFQNRDQVRYALDALKEIPSLDKLATQLRQDPVFSAASTVLVTNRITEIQTRARQLITSGTAILAFLNSVLPEAPQLYIAVSLPSDASTLDADSKLTNRLQIALDHPQRLLGHEPLRVSHIDTGSIWIELAIGSPALLGLLGKLIDLGTKRAKAQAEVAKADQERAKADQERAKADQEITRARREELNLTFEARTHELALRKQELDVALFTAKVEHAKMALLADSPNEVRNALETATEEIAQLHKDGARFRGQLNAPPEIARLLPESVRACESEQAEPKALPEGG